MKKKVGAGIGVVLINQEGQILMGKRHDDPEKADSILRGEGTWTIPGGSLDPGETFEEGAKREVLEETGINITKIKVICVNNDKNKHAHFVTIGLVAEEFYGEPKTMEPDEITEWKWFDLNLDKMPKKIFFPAAKVIKNYLKKQFYIKENNQ